MDACICLGLGELYMNQIIVKCSFLNSLPLLEMIKSHADVCRCVFRPKVNLGCCSLGTVYLFLETGSPVELID